MKKEVVWFKIVDIEKNKIKTLFHGLNGSRQLHFSNWYVAEKKMVTDGTTERSTKYLSGFHVIPSHKESVEYLKKFKNVKNKHILPCYVRGLRKKEHSPYNVWLADEIFLIPPDLKGIFSDDSNIYNI